MSAPQKSPAVSQFQWFDVDAEMDRLVALRVPSQPDRLRLVRSVVTEAATACGCSEAITRDIVLAVDEACQNIIRHAYDGDPNQEILLDLCRTPTSIVIFLLDFAQPVDVSKIRPRNLDDLKPGGLGTHFINECMDVTEYPPPPEGVGNLLRMEKKIV